MLVVGLAAIGTAIATFYFHDFNQKTNTESQVKQMAVDLDQMRMRAMSTKMNQGVKLTEFTYSFYSYSSAADAAGTLLPGGAHTVKVSQLSALPSTRFAGTTFQVDQQGMLLGSDLQTIYLLGSANVGAVNCLLLSATRTSLGKQNSSGGCDAQ